MRLNGMMSMRSYKSVWLAPGTTTNSLLSPFKESESVLSEIEGMGLVAMDYHHGILQLIGIFKELEVKEWQRGCCVETSVGVERPFVIASFCGLVVVVIVLYKLRGIIGERVNNSAAEFIGAIAVVFGTLGAQGGTFGVALCGGVLAVEIAVGVYACHIVHC